MRHPLHTFLAAALLAPAAAFGQLAWDVQMQPQPAGTPAPAQPTYSIYRGESISLQPRYLSGSAPMAISTNATAALWWQTNGMAGAYNVVTGSVLRLLDPGRVSVQWPSTNLLGVTSANAVIALQDGLTINLHAQFLLTFTPRNHP